MVKKKSIKTQGEEKGKKTIKYAEARVRESLDAMYPLGYEILEPLPLEWIGKTIFKFRCTKHPERMLSTNSANIVHWSRNPCRVCVREKLSLAWFEKTGGANVDQARIQLISSQYSPKNTRTFESFAPNYGDNIYVATWICPKSTCEHPHEWESRVQTRKKGANCPYCSGEKVCRCNSLAILFPDLLKQWDFKKNTHLDPYAVNDHSHLDAFWICPVKLCSNETHVHEWKTMIANRTCHNSGCPYCCEPAQRVCSCNSFATLRPELLGEFDRERNTEDPFTLALCSNKIVHWKCPKLNCLDTSHVHRWETTVSHRTKDGRSCPWCSMPPHMTCECNSLQSKFPELMSEWDKEVNKKNNLDPSKLAPASNKLAAWCCRKQHKWETMICDRTQSHSGCPGCRGSHGEKELNRVTDEMGLVTHKQKTIKCYNIDTGAKMTLRLDTYFELGQHKIGSEYDGKPHFQEGIYPTPLAVTISRDRSKNRACQEQGIHLLRIHYSDIRKIKFWMTKFIEEIKAFKPHFIGTPSGELIQVTAVFMVTNPLAYTQLYASYSSSSSSSSSSSAFDITNKRKREVDSAEETEKRPCLALDS